MAKLYFFTYSYPFSTDYPWKRYELEHLIPHFDIEVIPFIRRGEKYEDAPEGPLYHPPVFDEVMPVKYRDAFKIPFLKNRLFYLNEVISGNILTSKYRVLEWIASSLRINASFGNPVIRRLIDHPDEPEKTILYFYWGLGTALLIPFFRKAGYKNIIVRFHGFDLYEERRHNYLPFRKPLLHNLSTALFISRHGQKYLTDKYRKIPFDSRVFKLGSARAPENPPKTEKVFRVVSCSNVIPLKRVDMIAEALALLDFDVEWIHFGDGEMMDKVADITATFPANVKAVLKGRQPHSEIIGYYGREHIDLFLNVSTSEGLPVSVMEALSAGIPVFATDVGGSSEIVSEKSGKLLPADLTPEFLAQEIKHYYLLPEEAKIKLRNSARKIYTECCDIEKLTGEFIDFLLSLSGQDKN
ncbi:MAG: hypothetical protein Kow00127_01670 [Bacteroidales bacterium]